MKKVPKRRNPLREALSYAKDGWRIIPIKSLQKRPLIKGGGGFENASDDPDQLRKWWTEWPDANLAVRCDSTVGPVILDADDEDAVAYLKSLKIPPTLMVRTPSGGRHYYFAPDGKPLKRMIKPLTRGGEKINLDFLGDGGYALLPPSVVVKDDEEKRYSWVNKDLPLAILPSNVRALFEEASQGANDGGSLRIDNRVKKLPDVIHEGERDDRLTSLAGSMRRRGTSEEAILAALREENAQKCIPPLPDKEVKKIARSIAKKRPDAAEPALAKMNETYAIVQVGSDVMILQEKSNREIAFLSQRAFELLHGNRFLDVPAGPNGTLKPIRLTRSWLSWEGLRKYNRVVFEPGRRVARANEYNLYRGFDVQPNPNGSCDRFLAHLYDNVCQGDAIRYDWIMGWFAQLIQHPERKLGTSVVLRGPQGVGKSIVGKTIGHLLGRHQYVVASGARYVTGHFNSHLERCLLLHAEEAFWAGDKAAAGVLKDLITNEKQMIERKGVDSYEVNNYVRLLVTSNERWIVPAGLSERRFAVFDVGERHKQDHDYFKKLQAELDGGGYETLLYLLKKYSYDETELRQVPWTPALTEQILESLAPDDKWLVHFLTIGEAPYVEIDEAGRIKVATSALHRAYSAHAKDAGARHRSDETKFGIWLKVWFPKSKAFRAMLYDPRVDKKHVRRGVWLPSLTDCRAIVGAQLGKPKWGKSREWGQIDETTV